MVGLIRTGGTILPMRGLLLVLSVLAGCDSGGPMPENMDLSVIDKVGKFPGSYAATLNETVTLNGSGPVPFTTTATITFAAGTTTDLVETLSANGQNCMFTYTRNGDTATAFPVDQSCSYVLPNGSHQTNTDSLHTATLNGNTLIINISGKYVGTTSGGTPYMGTFMGAWTGTRQ